MAKIITKTGDKGMTSIFGGERVPKDDLRIETNGTMDELNAMLGVARSMFPLDDEWHARIGLLQRRIMAMMSLIATPGHRRAENPNVFEPEWVIELEEWARVLLEQTPNNGYFILPGGTPLSAHLQLARTIARRAERRLWTLHRIDPLPADLIPWVNRLSDLLFALAKWVMKEQGWSEDVWNAFSYKRKRVE